MFIDYIVSWMGACNCKPYVEEIVGDERMEQAFIQCVNLLVVLTV